LNTVNFKVTGNRFAINVETIKKDKYVAVRKNGEVKPYVSEVTINTNNVDEARDLKTILTLAVPLAVEKVKADMPAINSEKDGLQLIKSQVGDLKVGPKQITQQILAECLCKLTQTESDAKSTESNVYQFNWMDFNPAASLVDVSGDKLFIELKTTDKKKMIMHTKNDKFDGYEENVKLFLADVESARRLKAAVDKSIEKCKTQYKEPFGSDAASAIEWLKKNIKEVTLEQETHKQTLESVEDGKLDKLKFTNRELNPKGTGGEQVYEFSLKDINPLSIQVETKGKWLVVTFESEFKNKIFNSYKDGKIQPFASKIEFSVNDVELARNTVGALKKSVAQLKGK
jgi:prefoldin subunit 5